VSGKIPRRVLAVGSPAKVIRSAPEFPKQLSDSERSTLVATIMAEFDRFLQHSGVQVEPQGSVRSTGTAAAPGGCCGCAATRGWTASRQPVGTPFFRDSTRSGRAGRLRQARRLLARSRRPHAQRGRLPLTEEFALFIGRYGVRLARYYDRCGQWMWTKSTHRPRSRRGPDSLRDPPPPRAVFHRGDRADDGPCDRIHNLDESGEHLTIYSLLSGPTLCPRRRWKAVRWRRRRSTG